VRDQPDRSPPGGPSAERLARAARAAQQLCEVLWESLYEELSRADTARARALSQRLAEVSSTVAMLAGAAPFDTTGGAAAVVNDAGLSQGASGTAGSSDGGMVERRTPPSRSRPEHQGSELGPPDLRLASHPSSEIKGSEAFQSTTTRTGEYSFTRLVDEQEPPRASEKLASVEPIQPEISIHDVRREEGPSAWVSSVGQLLSRHAQDGLPFAVLLVEIVDVAQLERSATPHDMHSIVAQVESAIGRAMRSTDHLSRETLGRYWLGAPETNGTGALMLAERLARLVRTSATHRGVPLEVAIGIAVCPDDGTEAPALAARADLGVYSARATGRSVAHTDPPAG
jgi:GGDEF domain-containing protein